MATALTMLKAFKEKKLPSFYRINLQVQKVINATKFEVGDGSKGSYNLEIISTKSNLRKYFTIGSFIKVINPTLRKEDFTVLVGEKSVVCVGVPINGLPAPKPFLPIADTFGLDGQTAVPGKLLAKVVRIFDKRGPYASRHGSRVKFSVQIKDLDGSRQTLQFWRPESSQCPVQLNMIYILSNLRTDKISEKYFTEKPYSLNCDKDSDIAIATGPMKEALANVMYHDGNFKGRVLAINNVITYKSCSRCNRSVSIRNFEIGSQCPSCNHVVVALTDDFSFTLVVEIENEMFSMTCFKRLVCFEGPCDDEHNIEMVLMLGLEEKMAEGEYIKKKHADSTNFMVHTVIFS